MTFNQLLEKRMFLLVLFTLALFSYLGYSGMYGINRTTNWSVDIYAIVIFFKNIVQYVFVIGYGILALLKRNTHKSLSLAHLLLIIFNYVIDDIFSLDIRMYMLLQSISFVIFGINFIWSLVLPKAKNRVT